MSSKIAFSFSAAAAAGSKPVEGGAVKLHSTEQQIELVVFTLVSASITAQVVSVAVHSVVMFLARDRKRWCLVEFVEIPAIAFDVAVAPIRTKNK